jgi:hypothetical protein
MTPLPERRLFQDELLVFPELVFLTERDFSASTLDKWLHASKGRPGYYSAHILPVFAMSGGPTVFGPGCLVPLVVLTPSSKFGNSVKTWTLCVLGKTLGSVCTMSIRNLRIALLTRLVFGNLVRNAHRYPPFMKRTRNIHCHSGDNPWHWNLDAAIDGVATAVVDSPLTWRCSFV